MCPHGFEYDADLNICKKIEKIEPIVKNIVTYLKKCPINYELSNDETICEQTILTNLCPEGYTYNGGNKCVKQGAL